VPGERGEAKPVDFPRLRYIGMNRLGFTCRQTGHLNFGEWLDLFEAYKQQYNFEVKRMLYKLEEKEEKISSLDEL
jgi:hypothetical protein